MTSISDQRLTRASAAYQRRVEAAALAASRPLQPSFSNGEEYLYRDAETNRPSYIASFTKGLPHRADGRIINPDDFILFIRAIDSGLDTDIRRIPLGPALGKDGCPAWRSRLAKRVNAKVRGWESMAAGLAFSIEGPDAQSLAVPPAPRLNSPELAAEMAEVYLMAIARDLPFSAWETMVCNEFFHWVRRSLNSLEWFCEKADVSDPPAERFRRRGTVTMKNLFRGITPGTRIGPYISQFLILGSKQIGKENFEDEFDGSIQYGAISILQKVRVATPRRDFMTAWQTFSDVQDGADLRGVESYERGQRLITTPRDLATYVHHDALYEAYLNACLILLANKVPFDPGLPFQGPDSDEKQQGFAHFGGPHILSLVCEVATRALKAVRYQNFNVHRRLRPEAVGGLLHAHITLEQVGKCVHPEIGPLAITLRPILDRVRCHNETQNGSLCEKAKSHHGREHVGCESYLLPMAFPAGSPMHPSYGAGHATVAGACVTILKAFFDSHYPLDSAYEVASDGHGLLEVETDERLTVAGELNKLAENISIGRNWAGVHYFSDYIESMKVGEQIAIGILEEQKLLFGENFFMTVPKFDGTTVRI